MTIIKAVNRKRRSKDRFGAKAKVLEEQVMERRAEAEPFGEGIRDQKFKSEEAAPKTIDLSDITSRLGSCRDGFAEIRKTYDIILSIERARQVGDCAQESILLDSLRDWYVRSGESMNEGAGAEASEAATVVGDSESRMEPKAKAKVLEEQVMERRAEAEPLREGIRDQKFKFEEAAPKTVGLSQLTSRLRNCNEGFAEIRKTYDIILNIERARQVGDRAQESILLDSLRDWYVRSGESMNEGAGAEASKAATVVGDSESRMEPKAKEFN